LGAALVTGAPAAARGAMVFSAPAGNLSTGHLRGARFDAVLPSGRIITPLGASVVTGANALGFTLTPDARYAVVSNDDARGGSARSAVDPRILAGESLVVVDVATFAVVDRYALAGESFFAGVAAVRDPRSPERTLIFAAGGSTDMVYVFDLDANGRLTPDVQPAIALSAPPGAPLARSVPGTLVASPDGRRVDVVAEQGDCVFAIDTAKRALSGQSRAVGFAPFAAALAPDGLLVANEGALRATPVTAAPLVPPFMLPTVDPLRASSLSTLNLQPNGDLAPVDPLTPMALAMDPGPDGGRIVGGAHPDAIAVTPSGRYAFVAMANVDRIATVALGAVPKVVGGTELRLFDRGPYGTQPAALAVSKDGTRLYVALAGLNAVAVLDARDPVHLHRLGLLPTGWFPSALALSSDDRMLYVLNTKGFGYEAWRPDTASVDGAPDVVWSTFERIDLASVGLNQTTYAALKNTREVRPSAPRYPAALQHVVAIVAGDLTFDALLGDLRSGPGDPRDIRFGAAVTPNLHALARRFSLAGNFYADAPESDAVHRMLTSGTATVFSERTRDLPFAGEGSVVDANDEAADAPRSGSIFDNCARHGLSFRNYGDLVRLRGYDDGAAVDPAVDDPLYAGIDDAAAPTRGLGGRYAANEPAPAVLAGRTDLDYPGWNVRIRNVRRAREFIRDYAALTAAHREPRYTHIWLPADSADAGPGIPSIAERVADGDRALGAIIAYLTQLPSWRTSAIFVVSDGARRSRDHVAASRTYALVISPFARRHYVGMRHLSTVSVLKTSEGILGLPALALGDLLATDLSDFFTAAADVRPYTAIEVPVPQ
jgi:DNA-binding beta-propeller fold protein YncE